MGEATGRASVRQSARRAALAAQARLRAERHERDKRLASLAMEVLVALGEREVAVSACEQRAGAAIRQLLEVEQLSMTEVMQWCGPRLTRREIARLRRNGHGEQTKESEQAEQAEQAAGLIRGTATATATVTAAAPDAASRPASGPASSAGHSPK